jgi:hypothetical protein
MDSFVGNRVPIGPKFPARLDPVLSDKRGLTGSPHVADVVIEECLRCSHDQLRCGLMTLWTAPPDGGYCRDTVTAIGVDIVKSVFQVHGINVSGEPVVRRQVAAFF